jgi:hypothetical protein
MDVDQKELKKVETSKAADLESTRSTALTLEEEEEREQKEIERKKADKEKAFADVSSMENIFSDEYISAFAVGRSESSVTKNSAKRMIDESGNFSIAWNKPNFICGCFWRSMTTTRRMRLERMNGLRIVKHGWKSESIYSCAKPNWTKWIASKKKENKNERIYLQSLGENVHGPSDEIELDLPTNARATRNKNLCAMWISKSYCRMLFGVLWLS